MATARGEAAKEQRRKSGLFPSRDVDVPTALHLFEWSHYRFARSTEAMPPNSINAVLDALLRERPKDAAVQFLSAALDRKELQASWRAAVTALKHFQAEYSWGSKEKRERLLAIARDVRLLSALQTACVASLDVPVEFLAVLVLDGTDSSTDAVLPHFARAMKDPVRLDALAPLATFAKGKPQYAMMLAEIDRQKAGQMASSPVLALAKHLGLTKGDARFRVQVRMEGTPRANVWCDVTLDSGDAHDFRVLLSTGVGGASSITHFGTQGLIRDDLGLGVCVARELPQWLARAEKELGLRWNRQTVRGSMLRGKRLESFLTWLFTAA